MALEPKTKKYILYFGLALLVIIILYFVFFGKPGSSSSRQRKCEKSGGQCYVNIGGQLQYVDCSYCASYA